MYLMSRTITINVDEKVDSMFRAKARVKYGKRKGYLGKAVTEAMDKWVQGNDYDPNEHALMLLKKGLKLGGLTSKNRDEWHGR